MAKRFTDTNKYRKKFFRSLPGAYKLLWDYLYHDCDHAGIWIVDFEIAQTYLGKDMPISFSEAEARFNSDEIRVIPFDNDKKWFIPSFITFQYGKLSEKNRAHNNVIEILKKFSLINEDLSPITDKLKPLWEYPKGDKDMDKEKEMEQDKEKEKIEKEKKTDEKFIVPQMCLLWYSSFNAYTKDKENDYSGMGKILQFMSRQANIKDVSDIDSQSKVLNTLQLIADQVNREPFWINKPIKSIANNIQEFYNHLKNPINGNGKHTASKQTNGFSREGVQAKLNERLNNGK
jgi:ABC-type antimicrobial peptide transport system permease subunit